MDKQAGLHIRLETTMSSVAQKAHELTAPFFQTFAIFPCGRYLQLSPQDQHTFLELRKQFGPLFLHASYWINSATYTDQTTRLLERELTYAQVLGFDYLILHPGAHSQTQTKQEGIDTIARQLNAMLEKFGTVDIVLENVAHADRSIGGALEELHAIKQLVDDPARIGFCIDTAHAYVYGYNIEIPDEQERFIDQLEQLLEFATIKIIHLNDTRQACGSHIDQHAIPGSGLIGLPALQRFATHPMFADTPMLLELPPLEQSKELRILNEINELIRRNKP